MGALFDYVVFPILLPFILAWLLAARILSLLVPFLGFPSVLLARRLYWAVPFIEEIYRQQGPVKGTLLRIGFEFNYCANVVRRFLTLPLRQATPDFYIVGFPKCGTTSLANYMRQHPAISGLDGIPFEKGEVLGKESHFFNGALGRTCAASKLLYRSYFPTVLTRWWRERVLGVGKWLCFDACPLPACLPYTAQRVAEISPNAKLIFLLRDPVGGAFSTEIMFRNLGLNINWSLMEDLQSSDPRFLESPAEEAYWKQLERLSPGEPLPQDLMQRFYLGSPSAILRCGKYVDRIAPWLERFPRENILFLDFKEFTTNTQAVLDQVFAFVGADPALYKHTALPPGMAGERRGRRIHPAVKRKLRAYFHEPNQRLYSLLGRDFQWDADVEAGAPAAPRPAPAAPIVASKAAEAALPVIPIIHAGKPLAAAKVAAGRAAVGGAQPLQPKGGIAAESSAGSVGSPKIKSVPVVEAV